MPITPTTDYIVDHGYRVIATVRAGNGLNADQQVSIATSPLRRGCRLSRVTTATRATGATRTNGIGFDITCVR